MRWGVVLLAGLLGMSASVVGLLNARAQQFSTMGADADAPVHRMLGWQRGVVR